MRMRLSLPSRTEPLEVASSMVWEVRPSCVAEARVAPHIAEEAQTELVRSARLVAATDRHLTLLGVRVPKHDVGRDVMAAIL